MNSFNKDKENASAKTSDNQEELADKTRIAQPQDMTRVKSADKDESASLTQNDKTRIAQPQGRSQVKSPDKEDHGSLTQKDKTRLAATKSPQDSQNDKTRFAKARPQQSSDATQFKPKSNRNISKNTRSPEVATDFGDKALDNKIQNKEPKANILKKRFILEKVLGAGGMGVVYKAKDLVKVEAGDKDPYVAIKVLTEEFKEHPEAFVALQRESRKTQRIAHPNIVNVHDFDKDKSQVFMTMEFLEGKPLDQLIRQYKSTGLPTDDAINILRQLCQALIYAHEQKIIHSDFKPGNIFVTDKGVTKIFDFGIARAVAKAEHYEENLDDKTIFDAGDLGALTPAYASLEMLDGLEPDVRDDIYALGCVAYELFTGSHPFNKIPADEAQRQKMKPKRINNISRRLWKAIEKSLSFKREDRLASADEFLALMSKTESPYKLPMMFLLVGIILFAVYFQFFQEQPQLADESEIRSELEYTLRMENYRNSIDELIASKQFTEAWESNLWTQIQGVRGLLKNSESWLASTNNDEFKQFIQSNTDWYDKSQQGIYGDYLDNIQKHINDENFARAQVLITNAYRYVEKSDELDKESQQLQALIAQQKERLVEQKRKAQLAEEEAKKRQAEEAKIAAANAARQKQQSAVALKRREFNVALNNVQDQLKCVSSNLNMRNLNTAVNKLRSMDMSRYNKLENEIVSSLASCITRIGKTQPEKATELKKGSLRLFKKNRQIAAIKIVPRDPCDSSLAGLGSRGKRATCKDPVANIGVGPDLVVIPGKKGIKTFAIGKYEVSIAEMNLFCKHSKGCNENKSLDANMPLTNVSLQNAKSYLSWLSQKTGKTYRLPTKNEWLYAARSKRVALDPNRNCKLNTRGISKGDTLVRTTVGAQNGWGLVNYAGNASEWVYDKGRKLVAVGGSYNISMEQCNISTAVSHGGNADSYTGFRVLRELK